MKYCFFIVVLLLCLPSMSQKIKFNNFKLVEYDRPNDIQIFSLVTIDENGLVKVYRQNGLLFYSHQLSKNDIKTFNDLIYKNIKDYVIKKEIDGDYYGLRYYISFEIKNKHQKLCYVTPFMNEKFNETISLLYKRNIDSVGFLINLDDIKKEIKMQEEIDVLPERPINPPPQEE